MIDARAARLPRGSRGANSLTEKPREFSNENGADGQTRTADRRFTKPLLYQLSYVGNKGRNAHFRA